MGAIGRAFLAVVPPDEVLDALVDRIEAGRRLEPDVRWVRREQLHITLQFLGPVDDVAALTDALEGAVASAPPFEARLGGAGAFPRPQRASLVWTGVAAGEDRMTGLAVAVRGATAALGFEAEPRPFHPHVTMARLRRPKPLQALVETLSGEPAGPPFTVADIVLFRSETRSAGALYTTLEQIPLT